ncbi:hypothetical protein Lche_2543 [Legionella cherrii]|uniref:Uncharacterized protein n=1 Tax=Legionella cherrii TaxID=28084 RepID=A0A0W0SBR5_9GAMM|nr:hypothetical protein [Legionella cherrii]KTC80523.1 hypothetical protein Lche_2543 [Legionella cherrii]
MNQRLVWNFEFAPKASAPLATFVDKEDENLKWEMRYFWPDSEIIILNTIDSSLLDLANYKQKHKEDYYYLLPGCNYNIKKRHEQLLYKPLLEHANHAVGYGAKITINPLQEQSLPLELQKIIPHIETKGVSVYVKKEAFIYKFPTTPTIKIELARLEVLHKIYFSLCIEGKSRRLVETISQHLLNEPVSCEYVTFLKNLLKLC